ncbi:hypothetical protein NDU88_001387 [Pleurodeles waltl]|uniref:Uncharacterized protein n=1 Tax=Pleurodeles waltl TaxID=8319 RepID=A0AAV7VA72_PLEWA|nr:hypothetical protein NDU88_001387 [Pleurodeles waltl]
MTRQSATFSGADSPRIKTRRKQEFQRRNEDTMDPELQILPAIVFLLLYQEHERRQRRPRCVSAPAAHGLAVLEMAVPCSAVLEMAVPCSAVLEMEDGGALFSGASDGGALFSGASDGGALFSGA